ncbi:hypothetical protein QEG73_06100 [Chitinophagaceae bacterium 26-R-25]|nr:hypothetical protein [Chitinophagaceae bacterium 26-R-25]
MKPLFFLILLTALSSDSFAQEKPSGNVDKYLSKLPNLNLKLPKLPAELPQSENHFSKFTILDYRPDVSRTGICTVNNEERQISFKEMSVKQVVNDFLNNNYSVSAISNELIIVIKKLWYSSPQPSTIRSGSGADDRKTEEIEKSKLQFAAECYLKKEEGFIPFAAFDTTILSNHQLINCGSSILAEALNALVQKLNAKNIERIVATRTPFDKFRVDSISRRAFQHKIYTDDSLMKGVYMTFNDFLQNKPVKVYYETKKNKDGTSLYLKNENGTLYATRTIWGFCDGKTFYIMIDGYLFPACRNNYTFYVVGLKGYKTGMSLGSAMASSPLLLATGATKSNDKVIRIQRLFSVDNETGELL